MKVLPFVPALVLSLCAPTLALAQSPRLVGSAQLLVSTTTAAVPSPCDDSLFAMLRARPLDSLSTQEYAYLQDMTEECAESRRTRKLDPPLRGSGIAEWNSGSGREKDGDGLVLGAMTIAIVSIALSASLIYGLTHLFRS